MMLWLQSCQLNSIQDTTSHSLYTNVQICILKFHSLERNGCNNYDSIIAATAVKHQLQSS